MSNTALMHLDGCHFYIWVDVEGRLTFDEREGNDLAVHGTSSCSRCRALGQGATPIHEERTLAAIPSDPRESLLMVFEAVADIPGVAE